MQTTLNDAQVDILVTSTIVDRINTNRSIRTHLHEGFLDIMRPGAAVSSPLERAAQVVPDLRPRLIVAVGSIADDTTDLRQLRRAADIAGSQLVFWLHDDPYEFDYSYKADGIADVVFSNDSWAAVHYRHPKVFHLPLAASPSQHMRPITKMETRDYALFFCGVAYPNRADLLRKADSMLCGYPVAVLGAEWPSDVRCARNRRLTTGQMADHAQRSRLTLNIGRNLNIANQRFALPPSTPGPRTFEIALAGSTQLYVASGLEVLDFFERDREIILIDSVRDIERAIERAYDEPEAITAIAARAQQRVLRDHTYANRARQILAVCDLTSIALEVIPS